MTNHDKTRDTIDIISAALHGDKQTVVRAELALVRDDLAQRLGINTEQKRLIDSELAGVRQRILDLMPLGLEHPTSAHTREELEQYRAEALLGVERRKEERDCWNDIQHLRDVERNLLTQLMYLNQREERLRDLL